MKVRLTGTISGKQFEWRNDPRIYKYTRQNGILTEVEHKNWLNSLGNRTDVRMFGVVMTPASNLEEDCGTCGLTSISTTHHTAEFSLFIAPEFQGKGIGRAALTHLFDLGFGAMNLSTIWGETFVDNPALILFSKIGMTKEGILRSRYEKDNKRIDVVPISITREEWYADRS